MKEKRAFIEITRVKTDGIERELSRIAAALEMLLYETYGFRTRAAEVDQKGEAPAFSYTDHDKLALLDELERKGRKIPEEFLEESE